MLIKKDLEEDASVIGMTHLPCLKAMSKVLFRQSRHLVRLEHQLPCAGEELFKIALCNFCDFTKPLSGTLSMIEFISDIEFVSDIDQISLVSPIAAP